MSRPPQTIVEKTTNGVIERASVIRTFREEPGSSRVWISTRSSPGRDSYRTRSRNQEKVAPPSTRFQHKFATCSSSNVISEGDEAPVDASREEALDTFEATTLCTAILALTGRWIQDQTSDTQAPPARFPRADYPPTSATGWSLFYAVHAYCLLVCLCSGKLCLSLHLLDLVHPLSGYHNRGDSQHPRTDVLVAGIVNVFYVERMRKDIRYLTNEDGDIRPFIPPRLEGSTDRE
ncbi:hypothetical protein F5141DRAFT_1217425 [Pisolithus sp. B1]|nr:hypothetical protein F5141DRAFT_1217425 [Pisolithus sp. B1]